MLKPLNDRIVVKRVAAETVSIGGILIPGNATEKPEQGEVLAVGPGRRDAAAAGIPGNATEKPEQGEVLAVGPGRRDAAAAGIPGGIIPLSVKVGDKVLFGKYSGQTIKIKGEELLVMREEDVMGILGE